LTYLRISMVCLFDGSLAKSLQATELAAAIELLR
jgi:hypothetical protein